MRRRMITALFLATAISVAPVPSANASLPVIDPTNLAQNILTAARTLQQINNQVRQLQNEADMLLNEAKNLATLGFDGGAEIRRLLNEIAALISAAEAISFQIHTTEHVFQQHFPEDYSNWSKTRMANTEEFQWKKSRAAYKDTLLMQSKIVQTILVDTALLDTLVSESQRATGNLSVAQAGNQIMAINAKQNMQLQQMMASQHRAETLAASRSIQQEREAKEKHKRFIGRNSAY